MDHGLWSIDTSFRKSKVLTLFLEARRVVAVSPCSTGILPLRMSQLEITLFHLEREDIKIDIVARFEGDVLVIDGYDIGKSVEKYWGDSDYEYGMRIPPPGVDKLCVNFGLPVGDKSALLDFLATQYNSNTCYSQLERLISALDIQHESFKWT